MKKVLYLLLFTSFSVFSQNLVETNNSFQEGISGWDVGVWGDDKGKPVADISVSKDGHNDNSSVKIKVKQNTKNGKGDKVFVKYPHIQLKKKKKYEISFWIMSKFYDDEVLLTLYSAPDTGSDDKWGAVVDRSFPFTGDGKWHKISYTFEAVGLYDMDVDLKNLCIFFGFDKRRGTFWLDDVSLERVK